MSTTAKTVPQKTSFGGWLKVFCCWWMVRIVMNWVILFTSLGGLTGTLAAEKEFEFPELRVLEIAQSFVLIGLQLHAIFVYRWVRLYIRKAPNALIGNLVGALIAALLLSLWASTVLHKPLADVLPTYWPTFITALVWIPYFACSQRVKTTFGRAETEDRQTNPRSELTPDRGATVVGIGQSGCQHRDEASQAVPMATKQAPANAENADDGRRFGCVQPSVKRTWGFLGGSGLLLFGFGIVVGLAFGTRPESVNLRNEYDRRLKVHLEQFNDDPGSKLWGMTTFLLDTRLQAFDVKESAGTNDVSKQLDSSAQQADQHGFGHTKVSRKIAD